MPAADTGLRHTKTQVSEEKQCDGFVFFSIPPTYRTSRKLSEQFIKDELAGQLNSAVLSRALRQSNGRMMTEIQKIKVF
jgi:hypothetical protein